MFPATIGAHWTVTKSARRTPVDFIARQYNYFACCSRPPFDRGRGKRDVGKTLNKGGREKERKKKRERERERERESRKSRRVPRSMANNEPRTRPVCLPNNWRRGENNAKQSAIVSNRERLS